MKMYYVYILKSRIKEWKYVGYTSDLNNSIHQHKMGLSDATRNYRPLDLVSYVGVQSKVTALRLEKYFKTGSGIAWMNKHLLPK